MTESIGLDVGNCTVPAAAASGVGAIAAGDRQSLALFPLLSQTITVTVHAPASATYNGVFTVAASASSGLPVVFSSGGACTNSGAMFTMTSGAGTCLVRYDQPGQGDYNAAPQMVESVAAQKTEQTIAFGALAAKTYGDPDFPVNASASSGLAVSFSASGNCTLSGPLVHITGAGTCAVTASQPGDANYNAAPNASQSFSVAKANQTITFGALANKANGAANFTVSASASSGLAVSFAARGKCSVSAATVHLTGAGSCTVTASQPGDANYNPAPDVSRTFSIARVPCTVPRVVGKQLAVAKQTIKRRHCRTGKVGYSYSGTSKNGIVIRQSRRPGRVAPADSKIDLVVSRGRR